MAINQLRIYRITHEHRFGTDVQLFQTTKNLSKGYSRKIEDKILEKLSIEFERGRIDESIDIEEISKDPIPVIEL